MTKKWQIFLFFAFNVLTIRLFAQVNSPQVSCVQVLANGDVTISWQQPVDPLTEFTSYNIFSSNSLNGIYTPIAIINSHSTISYTHIGANATSTQPKFYYITTTSNGSTTLPAIDTVRTIFLVITNPNNGVAYLQWNAISDPLPTSSSLNYNVYREYPTGTYTLLGTTTDLKWRDTINICSYFLNYRVEIADASGCNSVSNVSGSLLRDFTPPIPPSIDSVSINNVTNQTIIGISPSISGDAAAFVIYSPPTGSTTLLAIDTLPGNTNVLYPVATSSPNSSSGTFSIASVDSCGNISTSIPRQNTMFLNNTYSICGKSVLLGWNPYLNMKGGLLHYKIYMSINGGAYSIVGNTTQPSYTQFNLIPNKTYSFFVRAFNNGETITSTSNIISFFTDNQSQPSYVYIKSVSVQESQDIIIGIKADSTKYFRGIAVYRALDVAGPFDLLGSINANGTTNYVISDNNVETSERTYYYKAVIIDSCGLETVTSNVSRSIVLEAKSNSNRTNTLAWIDYESYLGTVVSYNIYRSVDDVFNPAPIANVSGSLTTFVDDVIELVPNQGRFSYYVQAVEGTGNPFGVMALSNSNIVDTYHTDSIFVPNAFVPKGVNKVFLPMTQYVEKTEYKLSIYDRWGLKIWETADDSEGWDGEKMEGGLVCLLD
jgi:hypothetical protein